MTATHESLTLIQHVAINWLIISFSYLQTRVRASTVQVQSALESTGVMVAYLGQPRHIANIRNAAKC